jgi:hypothetical protein
MVIPALHFTKQLFGRLRDVLYGCLESRLINLGGFARAAHLPDELESRGGNFVRRHRSAAITENFDASAHFCFPNHYATVTSAGMTPIEHGSIRGFLHEPVSPRGKGLVLTHGAGANAKAPLLVAVANAFCEAGYVVLRCDLPFRQKRPFGPPSPAGAAQDRGGLRDASALMRSRVKGKVILGGHSYGGRQATMLAAEDPQVSDALLLLSYPLHPPEKPHQLRTQHFPALRTPALFVHGSKDPFGSIAEMETALKLIPATVQLIRIEGAGHDLAPGKFDPAPLAGCELF